MLRSVNSIDKYRVSAIDGDIGSVQDFFFDDERWTIRYLIVDTGGFWNGPHRVLISPNSFREVDWSTRSFHLALTRDKVKNSPEIDLDKPVSRQFESEYSRYYGWPAYYGEGVGRAGTWRNAAEMPMETTGDPHLRSVKEVVGYQIQGSDAPIGHVDDLIVDDETWAIRYLVIDTRNWWLGKKVLVAPLWADKISWTEEKVYIDLPRELIKNSPEWRPDAPVNRAYETRLFDYYGRPAYWAEGEKEEAPHVMAPYEKHPQ